MGMLENIKDGIVSVYHKVTRAGKKILSELGKGIENLSQSVGLPAFVISSGILSLAGLVSLPLAPVIASILGTISTISEGITAAGAFSAAVRSNNYEQAIGILSTTKELQNRFAGEVGKRMSQLINLPVFKVIGQMTDSLWQYVKPLKERIETVYNYVKGQISINLAPIIQRISDIDDRIGGYFSGTFSSIQDTVTAVLRGQLSPVEQMIQASNLGEKEYRDFMNNRTYAWIIQMERIP